MKKIILFFCVVFTAFASAQVVSVTPAFPAPNDSVTIIFDAAQGNLALNNYVGDVWAHTGIVDNYSANVNDWRYIKNKWTWEVADSSTLMTPLGNNQYKLRFKLRNYYGVSASQNIRAMGFVFRNTSGSLVGKNANGSDIIIPVYKSGFSGNINSPAEYFKICNIGDAFPFNVSVKSNALITLYQDGQILSQALNTLSATANIAANTVGKHWLKYSAQSGANTFVDSMYYIVKPAFAALNPPAGTKQGINYIDNSTVRFCLLAPWKDNVFVIGPFSNWEVKPEFLMNRAQDGETYWLDVTGLQDSLETGFQYVVDGGVRVGDPYCEKIIDADADGGISQVTYPNILPQYPFGKTQGIISVFNINAPQYNWGVTNFQRPDNRDLVIYELLIRDYTIKHDFKTTLDSLPYLKKLGVNAVQLMPIIEYDGNNGWGYSPNYFTAVDKYYGKADNLKILIDSIHAEGMAVILDVVFNHCFGQSPWAKLWWNGGEQRPSYQNPFCNPIATHPYSVGYDFNHDSPYVKNMVDTVLDYWVTKYKFDGFRFDLSKGFTQTNSGGDIGLWTQYDQSRVNNILRIANEQWARHPGTYVILEHLGDNSEETVLANAGCMLWSKASYQLGQTLKGYDNSSDFEYPLSYHAKNWTYHNCVGYSESHDEERLMFENYEYGNVAGAYSAKDTVTALQRSEMIAPFLLLTPGPKMMWMFQEMGYDVSINSNGGRTNPKNPRWDYLLVPERLHLMKTYAAIINLKKNYRAFRSSNYDLSAGGKEKQLYVTNNNGNYSNNIDEMNATIFANADVIQRDTYTGFQHTGRWFDYLSGDSIEVSNTQMTYTLQPGDFRIFLDHRLPKPNLKVDVGLTSIASSNFVSSAYPNPFETNTSIAFETTSSQKITVNIFDMYGKKVKTLLNANTTFGNQQINWNGTNDTGNEVKKGCYFYEIITPNGNSKGKLVKL